MKTYLIIFLLSLQGALCFADIAVSPSYKNVQKSDRKESIQQLWPNSNSNINGSESSPTIVIKLLKFIWLIIMLIVATILPPLAILIYFGAHRKFWVCLLLTLLFWVPGIIYAWVQIIKGRKARKQGAI